MNFKESMKLRFWNVPEEFRAWFGHFEKLGYSAAPTDSPEFLLAFVHDQKEVGFYLEKLLPFMVDDQVFWMAFPKKSSKKYQTDISRDSGWGALAKYDFGAVRNVAMNED